MNCDLEKVLSFIEFWAFGISENEEI